MRNQDTTNAQIGYKRMCEKRIEDYNSNPWLCLHCKTPIPYGKRVRGNKFCNHACSAKYNNRVYLKLKGHGRNKCGINGKHMGVYTCKSCGTILNSRIKFCNDKCKIIHKTKMSVEYIGQKIRSGEFVHRDTVRKYLLLTREYKCFVCNRTKWRNKPIPLESHHKDGNYKNNSDENLELICLNCHSQTDTYRGKNRGKGRGEYKKRT